MASKGNPTNLQTAKGGGRDSRAGSLLSLSIKNVAVNQEDANFKNLPKDDITMTIKVHSAKNIRGSKGEHVNSQVRVQFADFDFKDSQVVNDSAFPEFNFTFEQTFNLDDTLIELFANSSIMITLCEILPKDKTALLGNAEVPLMQRFLKPPKTTDSKPILSFKDSVPILYVNHKLVTDQPEIEIEVIISKPIIHPAELERGSFVSFRIEDMYPVPDEWSLKDGTEKDLNSNIYMYNIDFYLPSESNNPRKILVNNGILVSCEAPAIVEGIKSIRANDPIQIPPNKALELPPPGDSKKVMWSHTHTIWLSEISFKKLREKVQRKETFDLELYRLPNPKFSSVVDVNALKYRAVAQIDLSPLLFPGICGISGRFNFDAQDHSLHENLGRDTVTPSSLDRSKSITAVSKPDFVSPYKIINTGIQFKIAFEKPFQVKTKVEVLYKNVSDFIPKRYIPENMIQDNRSKKADEDYRTEIQSIVALLVGEYRAALTSGKIVENDDNSINSLISQSDSEEQAKKKKLLYHLNRTGSYYTFKEKLKSAVVQIVREKFIRKSNFASQDEQQLFLSEVYVYLVDQMHIAINNTFLDKDTPFVDPTVSKTADFEALKTFANTAEYDFRIDVASEYHQERVAKYESKMQSWYDYACFCLRNGEKSKGEECLKEILSRNPKHINSLLAYATICCMGEKFAEAKTCLNTVIQAQPNNTIGLVLMGLYYEAMSEEKESQKYIEEACQIHGFKTKTKSIFLITAEFLINIHASQLAEMILSRELLCRGRQVEHQLLLAELEIQKRNFGMAALHLREAMDIKKDDPNLWSMQGHLLYIQNKWEESKESYETVLSLTIDKNRLAIVYHRLGTIYLKQAIAVSPCDENLAKLSKSVFLQACNSQPSSHSWLGVGRASFVLGELQEAEDAYSEANVLDNRNSEVWAHLAILNLELDRLYEASQSLAQALRLIIKDKDLLKTLGSLFLKKNLCSQAIECFRIHLELQPGATEVKELFSKALQMEGKESQSRSQSAPKVTGSRGVVSK